MKMQVEFFKKDGQLTQSAVNNQIKSIIDSALSTQTSFGDAKICSNLAKNVTTFRAPDNKNGEVNYYLSSHSEAIDENEAKRQLKIIALNTYNRIVGSNNSINFTNSSIDTAYNTLKNNIKNIDAYYEYNQFKKAKFNCKNISYDDENSGRVKQISFEYVGLQ